MFHSYYADVKIIIDDKKVSHIFLNNISNFTNCREIQITPITIMHCFRTVSITQPLPYMRITFSSHLTVKAASICFDIASPSVLNISFTFVIGILCFFNSSNRSCLISTCVIFFINKLLIKF